MAHSAFRLAAAAYAASDESLADAALVLARRWPRDLRALALAALVKGGGAPAGALFIGGVPVTINGVFIVIGATA